MDFKKIKLNIIDLAVITVVLLFAATFVASQVYKPKQLSTKLKVTVRVYNKEISDAIYDQAEKDKVAYLNGVNKPVNILEVKRVSDGNACTNYLDIVLNGPGKIDSDGSYEFNGQRLLINQKAEIHGNYFVSGAILKIENAN